MTDVIKVVAVVATQPGRAKQLLERWPALAEQVRAEDGCLAYDLHPVAGEADRFVVIERWASMAAVTAHGKSAHIKEFSAEGFFQPGPQLFILPEIAVI